MNRCKKDDHPSSSICSSLRFEKNCTGKNENSFKMIPSNKEDKKKESKWLQMISKMKPGNTKAKFHKKVFLGIPESLRGIVWPTLIDPFRSFNLDQPSVQSLIEIADPNLVKLIENDVGRTLVHIPEMKKSEMQNSLKRVLLAYAGIDKSLGYSQGMAFPAALLLLHLDENSAFWCFYQLMLSPRFGFREIYSEGFPRVQNLNKVWNLALQNYFPKIYQKLNQSNIDPIIYTISWWMTAFSSFPFPLDILLLIFDRYIVFGSTSLISFALTLIGISYDFLMKTSTDEVISFLQQPCSSLMLNNPNLIKSKWNEYWINKKDFKKLLEKAGIPHFP